jgi:hypothetical protein
MGCADREVNRLLDLDTDKKVSVLMPPLGHEPNHRRLRAGPRRHRADVYDDEVTRFFGPRAADLSPIFLLALGSRLGAAPGSTGSFACHHRK